MQVEKFKPRYFLGPLNRANVLRSSSLVRLTARRRMYTTIKMIMIAVAIGMWIGPRSVFIAFVVREIGLGFDVLTDLNATTGSSHLRSNILSNFA